MPGVNEPVYPGHYYSEILHFGPIFPTINTYAPVGLSFRRAVECHLLESLAHIFSRINMLALVAHQLTIASTPRIHRANWGASVGAIL